MLGGVAAHCGVTSKSIPKLNGWVTDVTGSLDIFQLKSKHNGAAGGGVGETAMPASNPKLNASWTISSVCCWG